MATPPVLWAQRADKLYLTIDLQDAKNPKIDVSNDDAGGKISFSGVGHSHASGQEDHEYSLEVSDLPSRLRMHMVPTAPDPACRGTQPASPQ
jgi:hypothetical protein